MWDRALRGEDKGRTTRRKTLAAWMRVKDNKCPPSIISAGWNKKKKPNNNNNNTKNSVSKIKKKWLWYYIDSAAFLGHKSWFWVLFPQQLQKPGTYSWIILKEHSWCICYKKNKKHNLPNGPICSCPCDKPNLEINRYVSEPGHIVLHISCLLCCRWRVQWGMLN